jgi:hypothetical protein
MAKSFIARTAPWLLLALTVAACQAPVPTLSGGAGQALSQQGATLVRPGQASGGLRVAVRWPDRRIQDIAYRTEVIEVMVWQRDGAGNLAPARQEARDALPVAIATDSEPVAVELPAPEPGEASASASSSGEVEVQPILLHRDQRSDAEFVGLLGGEGYVVKVTARDAEGKEIGHGEATCDVIPGTSNGVAIDMKASNPPLIDGFGPWPQEPLGPGATLSVLLKGHEKDLPVEADLVVEGSDTPYRPLEAQLPGPLTTSPSYPYHGAPRGIVRLESQVLPGEQDGPAMVEVKLPDALPDFARYAYDANFSLVLRVDNVRSNPLPLKIDRLNFGYESQYPKPTPYPTPDFERPTPEPTPEITPEPSPGDGDPTASPNPGPSDVIDGLDPFPDFVSVHDVGALMCRDTGAFMTESALEPWGISSIRTLPNPSYGPPGQNITEGHVPAFFGRDFGICAIGTTPAGTLPGPGTGYGAAHVQLHFAQPRSGVVIDFLGGPKPYFLKAYDATGSMIAVDDLQIASGTPGNQLHRLQVFANDVPIQRVIIGCPENAGVLIRRIAHAGIETP